MTHGNCFPGEVARLVKNVGAQSAHPTYPHDIERQFVWRYIAPLGLGTLEESFENMVARATADRLSLILIAMRAEEKIDRILRSHPVDYKNPMTKAMKPRGSKTHDLSYNCLFMFEQGESESRKHGQYQQTRGRATTSIMAAAHSTSMP